MPTAIVMGGGLAGLATTAALTSAGFEVDVFEARAFPGGRATSWPAGNDEDAELVDNCQHVLLKCCVNLLDFYRRLGVLNKIRFYDRFTWIEPGGHRSVLKRGMLPAPMHFAGSFLRLKFLGPRDKLGIAIAMNRIPWEIKRRDLENLTMLQWLEEKKQTVRAIDRYWGPVLVSAVNEELHRMAASHGLQVFWLGMIARADSYEMGMPVVPLRELYAVSGFPETVRFHERAPVTEITSDLIGVRGIVAGGRHYVADYYISALPFEKLQPMLPELAVDWGAFEHSPITGIHLWFNRPITDLPHAVLLDRTIQWMFNREGGRYVQLVVSASRKLTPMSRQEVIDLAMRELADFFPNVRGATLEKAHVVKEMRATFSAKPGLEQRRPAAKTRWKNFFLAGDWTRTGWPATMEGAVRSGYLAAEEVTKADIVPRKFLLPDIA
jgi:zeta-carotene desaturase